MTTVLLVDDEPMVCDHLSTILGSAPDIDIVGVMHDGPSAVEATARLRPDLVLMDLRMPLGNGLSAIREIRDRGLPSHVVVLTVMDDDELVRRAVRAGASGFLTKSTPAADLIELVRVAARGHGVVSPHSLARLVGSMPPRDPALARRMGSLTERESQVLLHLGVGDSNARIADAMGLSEATIKGYVSHILTKLDCENRSQAALLARAHEHRDASGAASPRASGRDGRRLR